jgi:hypothetical protein
MDITLVYGLRCYGSHLPLVALRSARCSVGTRSVRITPKSVRVIVSQNHEHKGEKPVAVYCFTQLIQPGKREDAKAIFEEIQETRRG